MIFFEINILPFKSGSLCCWQFVLIWYCVIEWKDEFDEEGEMGGIKL